MAVRQDLAALRIPEQPVISEDGTRVAYVQRSIDWSTDSYSFEIHVVGVDAGSAAVTWSNGPSDHLPAWSPQGVRFLRELNEGTSVCEASAPGEIQVIAQIPMACEIARWTPNGDCLAFVRPAGEIPESEVWMWDQPEGLRRVASLSQPVLDLAWSPDGAGIAVVVPHGAAPEITDVTCIMLLDPERRRGPQVVGGETGHVSAAGFTADAHPVGVGRADTAVGLAYIVATRSGLSAKSDGTAEGSVRDVAPGCCGYDLLAMIREGPVTRLFALDLATERRKSLTPPETDVLEMSRNVRSDSAAVVVRTPTSPGEILMVNVETGEWCELGVGQRMTSSIQRLPRSWTMADGRQIHGWLVTGEVSSAPRPLLLDLHGGPHTSWTGTVEQAYLYHEELVRQGWTVVLPNLSGSDGFGETHLRRVLGQWGVPDSREAWSVIDQLVTEGIADPARLAVTGYSYGGFLANTMVTQDRRFGAAVVGNATADLAAAVTDSALGDFIASMEIGARPDEDPDLYDRLSPSAHVSGVRTPVLVMHARDDEVVPPGQARHWSEQLRAHGVQSEYRSIDGADHEFLFSGRPSHRDFYYRQLTEWLHRFIPPAHTKGAP